MGSVKTREFSLKHSLECGQVFRWKRQGEAYFGFIENTPVRLEQRGSRLLFDSYNGIIGKRHVENYFRLDDRLAAIRKRIGKDKAVARALKEVRGLRLVRQQPWECLASYITSPRTKIAMITRNLDRLAAKFGERVVFWDREWSLFPSPEELENAGSKRVEACGLRTRKMAEGLWKTAKAIASGGFDLDGTGGMEYEEARKELMRLYGVGPKVADCVCLFGFGMLEAFPVDVWMRKIVNSFYIKGKFEGESLSNKQYDTIRSFAREKFGKNAGYAQEYLYYFYRTNNSYVM